MLYFILIHLCIDSAKSLITVHITKMALIVFKCKKSWSFTLKCVNYCEIILQIVHRPHLPHCNISLPVSQRVPVN